MDRDHAIAGVIILFVLLLFLCFASGFFGGGAGGGGGGGGGGAGVPCASGADCPAGQICLNGLCVPSGSCGSDSDCPAGSLCVNGMCSSDAECSAEVPCPFGECVNGECTGCGSDTDCPAWEVCINNVCTSSEGGCSVDADCPPGYACEDNVCTQSECSASVPCPDGQKCVGTTCQDMVCPDDFTCPPGQICKDGSCKVSCTEGSCPPGMECDETSGECEGAPCTDSDECPPGMECIDDTCQEGECATSDDCPPGFECEDDECTAPCEVPCGAKTACPEGATCTHGCCMDESGMFLSFDPFGTYTLSPLSFCDGCPAEDSLVTLMFLDPKLEDKKIGSSVFAEAEDGGRPAAEDATVFVHILSLDLEDSAYCKMVTDEGGEAQFDYSAYPFCEDKGCKITFTFCCADISEGCLIPVCLNDPTKQQHEDISACSVAEGESPWPSPWPEKASVDGEFTNLYPSIDSISIPPKPKLMGIEFAFQLCFPILVIFGLLSAAMFASGRNPFEMFSLYNPRFKRAPERAIRARGMNWNINSMVGSLVSAAQSIGGMKKDEKGDRKVDPKTGASKSEGKMPGFTIGGRVAGIRGTLGDLRTFRREGVGGVSKSVFGSTSVKGGPAGSLFRADTSRKQSALAAIGMSEKSGGRQFGAVLGTIGGTLALRLISALPGGIGTLAVYGGQRKERDADGNVVRRDEKGNKTTDGTGKISHVPIEGLLTKLNSAVGNYEGAVKAINRLIDATWATAQTKTERMADGTVTKTFSFVDPATGKTEELKFNIQTKTESDGTVTKIVTYQDSGGRDVTLSFSDAPGKTPLADSLIGTLVDKEGCLAIDKSLAPVKDLQVFAMGQLQGEKRGAYVSEIEDLSDLEASKEMKKKIKEMSDKEYDALQARLADGTATHDDAVLAAHIVQTSENEKERHETLVALGGFVTSGHFEESFPSTLQKASDGGILRDKGEVDATEVAREGLFVLGVAGHHLLSEDPEVSAKCNNLIVGTMAPIVENLTSNKPEGAPLVFEEGKKELAKTAESIAAVAEYKAASDAYNAAANDLLRINYELFTASRQALLNADSNQTLMNEQERQNLEYSNKLIDSLAESGLISKQELRTIAAWDRAFDPEGNVPRCASASEALGVAEGKDIAPSHDPIYQEEMDRRITEKLADAYGLPFGEMAGILDNAEKAKQGAPHLAERDDAALGNYLLNQGFEDLNRKRNELAMESTGQPAPELKPPETIEDLNKMRAEVGLPPLPTSFDKEYAAAYNSSKPDVISITTDLASNDPFTRNTALENMLHDRWEPKTFILPEQPVDPFNPLRAPTIDDLQKQDLKISNLVETACPQEPSKTSVAEAGQEKYVDEELESVRETEASKRRHYKEVGEILDSAKPPRTSESGVFEADAAGRAERERTSKEAKRRSRKGTEGTDYEEP